MKPLEALDQVINMVLAYRPEPKSKKAKQREEERKKVEREERKKKG